MAEKRYNTFYKMFSSAGRIRTYNQLVNSELRYHCATAECDEDYSQERAKLKVGDPAYY